METDQPLNKSARGRPAPSPRPLAGDFRLPPAQLMLAEKMATIDCCGVNQPSIDAVVVMAIARVSLADNCGVVEVSVVANVGHMPGASQRRLKFDERGQVE